MIMFNLAAKVAKVFEIHKFCNVKRFLKSGVSKSMPFQPPNVLISQLSNLPT